MKKHFLWVLLWLGSFSAVAQELWADAREPVRNEESRFALAIIVTPPQALEFLTVEHYRNGVTITHPTLTISGIAGVLWTIQVRAAGNLQNGSFTIPIGRISLGATSFTGTGVNLLTGSTNLVLSTANQTLISGALSLLNLNIVANLTYRASGGVDFLEPAGNYTTTLTFTTTGL